MLKSNKLSRWYAFPSLILLFIFAVIAIMVTPYFFNQSYLSGFAGAYVPLMLGSIAQAVVLIGGGIDISIGSVIGAVNVTIIVLVKAGVSPVVAVFVALCLGLTIGALNGVIISFLRVNPFLTTLATSTIATGTALLIKPAPGGKAPAGLVTWYQKSDFFIPNSLLFVLLVFVIWTCFRMSPAGTQFYAAGNHRQKAYVSGVRVQLLSFFSYLFSGFTAAVAGIAMTASTGAGSPFIGQSVTLNSVAACVIGGIALTGGLGGVVGAIIGSAFLGFVFITALAARFPTNYQGLITGLIILVSLLAASYSKRKQQTAL